MKIKKNHRYYLSVLVLLGVALFSGALSLGSALQIKALDVVGNLIDVRPFDAVFIGVVTGILGLLAFVVYLLGLTPHRDRPRGLVFLNLWAPALYLALALVGYDRGVNEDFTMLSFAGAPAAALLPPLLLMAAEAALYRMMRALGQKAQHQGWRKMALRSLLGALAFRPADRDTRRRAGLLYVEEDECAKGLALLEPMEPQAATDEEFLKALEHCYRAVGKIRDALRVLLRLQQLLRDQAWIDRRILDDYVRLEMHREALDLLESGRLKMNLELLQLAEKLNLTLGHYAQAMAQIRQIATEEGRPHNLAIRLYREMLEKLSDHAEVRINLGVLMLDSVSEERRREGAALLEAVLAQEPHRLHLARQLVQFYTESNELQAARKHLKALVEAGDPDPEYHLALAQMLNEEEQYPEAAKVLNSIIARWPEDWRGHMKLARTFLQLDRLDEAEKELQRSQELAPAEASSLLDGVRNGIEQRRRTIFVKSMREDVARNSFDVEKRLELVDHQIAMEWIDEALNECDRLLDESPALLPAIITQLEKGIARVPRSYSLRSYLSDIYFQQGRYDDVLKLYREMATQSLHPAQVITDGCRMILNRVPGHLEARRELALARRGEEDWAGVLEALDPPIHESAPLPAEDKVLWVEAAYRLWRLDGAVRVGMSLVNEMTEEVGFMLMLIDLLMDAGEFDKALDVFARAKAANPGDERLGRLEHKVMTSRARYRLNALQRQVTNGGELSPAEHYEKAELHRSLGQNEEAIVHYQRATYDDTLAPLATAKLAETLCDRGMYDLADETLDPLEMTRDLALSHPEIKDLLYRVGRMLEKLRRFDQAVKYYKRIFRVDAAYEDIVERIERLS